MGKTLEATRSPELQVLQIPIGALFASPTNPRKSVDEAALRDLAESIQTVGITILLQVRVNGGSADKPTYEILCGERRWRAATMIGMKTVPAIVRTMNDAEARELQLIDNLQRQDLSPMEEAEGYEQLIQRAADDGLVIPDEVLAHKVGKPVGYVRSRRKVLDLIPEARAGLHEGLISFGCGLLISKLLPADQAKATIRSLNSYAAKDESVADVLTKARGHRTETEKELAETVDEEERSYIREGLRAIVTENVLKNWIEENILLDLAKAPWPLEAIHLNPEAVACTDCPKRTGADLALFAELTAKSDVCTDPQCFAVKRSTFVHITQEEAKASGKPLLKLSMSPSTMPMVEGQKSYKRGQWLEAKPGECPDVQPGITPDGEVLQVCIAVKCKVHKHVVSAAPRRTGSGSHDSWEEDQKRKKAKQDAYLAKETPIRKAVYAAIRGKLKGAKLLRVALNLIVQSTNVWPVSEFLGIVTPDETQRTKIFCRKAFAAKDVELEGWLSDVVLAPYAIPNAYDDSARDRYALWAIAKDAGVNAEAIAKQLEAKSDVKPADRLAAKQKTKPKARTTAKPAAKSTAKKAVKKSARNKR